MSYVIVRREKGRVEFVTPSGSQSSFTTSLNKARVFATRADAEKEKCDNETIRKVDSLSREGYW